MTNDKKTAPALNPRGFWLHDRTRDCITALRELDFIEDYHAYREQAKQLAKELLYAVTEWEKYYDDNQ